MRKEILRKKILQKLKNLSNREGAIKQIHHKILTFEPVKKSKKIFTYISTGWEVDTYNLIKIFKKQGKKIYAPVIKENEILPGKIDNLKDLKKGKFGIMEPVEIVEDYVYDIILIPGVGFDRNLNRLGRGKGYFDRFLKKTKGLRIGVCFEIQIVDFIPVDKNDIKMDVIITEKNLYYGKKKLKY